MNLSPETLAVVQSQLWRRSPAALRQHIDQKFSRPPHIEFISNTLAHKIAKGGARVIVQVPPRHGKSEICSVSLPAWFLSLWPDRRVCLVGYEQDFAIGWGRRVKDVAGDNPTLGIELRQDIEAAGRWATQHGGGMFCTGVGGPLLGKGFELGIIDDPVKNAEEAQSSTVQERNWNWWKTTFRTRAEPGASIVIIMQRWDENDLVGKLLAEMKAGTGEAWEVISFPAEAEEHDILGRKPGEPLWPERYDKAALAIFKRDPYWWATQFQQRPAPLEGGLFKLDDLRRAIRPADLVPSRAITEVRYWDKAATKHERESNRSPQTAGVKGGIDYEGAWWITDVIAFQEDPPGVERRIAAVAEADGQHVPVVIEQEPGSGGKDVISHYQRHVLRGYSVTGHLPGSDKITRAAAFAAEVRKGNVRIVRAEWNESFFEELAKFPNGARKDQVDATTGLFAVMPEIAPHRDWGPDDEPHGGMVIPMRRPADDDDEDDAGPSSPFDGVAPRRTGSW